MNLRYENPFQMVRLLKGAAISLLTALRLAETVGLGPQSNAMLERATGYSDKSVAQGLALLEEYGLVRRGRTGWLLAGGAVQLPLALPTQAEPGAAAGLPAGPVPPEEHAGEPAPVEPPASESSAGRKHSGAENFRPTSSGSRFQSLDSRENLPQPDSSASETEKFRQVLAELDRNGIRDPARRRLARLPHVTLDLVRYHCATAGTSGQAIYRIENNWPIEERWQRAQELAGVILDADDDAEEDGDEEDEEAYERLLERWEEVKTVLRPAMKNVEFATWVVPLTPVGLEDDTLLVRACNPDGKQFVEGCLARMAGPPRLKVLL